MRLNRAVAVGEADGPQAGLAALAELDPTLPRYTAVAAYLRERTGDLATAAQLYAEAAAQAQTLAERNHLTLRSATLRQCGDVGQDASDNVPGNRGGASHDGNGRA